MIIAIYGNVGYGKGILMMYLIQFFSTFKDQIKRQIYTNFHVIGFKNVQYVTIDQFLNLQRDPDPNVYQIAFIDEPQKWGMDSRRGNTDIALELTSKGGTQSRKAIGDIVYATQIPSNVDKRERFLARAVFLALQPDQTGYHYLFMGRNYKVVHVPMSEAVELYNHYDTYEEIEPTFSLSFLKKMEELEEEEEKESSPNYLKKLLREGKARLVK